MSPKKIQSMLPERLKDFLRRRICTFCEVDRDRADKHPRLAQARAMLRKSNVTLGYTPSSLMCRTLRSGMQPPHYMDRAPFDRLRSNMPKFSSLSREDILLLCEFFDAIGWTEAKGLAMQKWSGLFSEFDKAPDGDRGLCGI